MAKKTRIWPNIITTSTLVIPATAPTATSAAPHLNPTTRSPSATGRGCRSSKGTSPVRTAATVM